MPKWVRGWLACCAVFAVVMFGLTWTDQYDSVAHDTSFFTVMVISYLLVAGFSYMYFRRSTHWRD
jgi:hypothetical protein